MRTRWRILLFGIALLGQAESVIAASGYATRNLNPILQPIYLPTLVTFSDDNGWRIDHSFYITNTLQQESVGDEKLVIDVENYRYELGLRYRHDKWLARLDLPFISNRGGELDDFIEDWHDFFGLPQGKRSEFPKDKINLKYQRDGDLEYHQNSNSSGLGDMAIAIGYQPAGNTSYFVGIELPTGAADDFTGNEAIDTGLWLTHHRRFDAEMSVFAQLGVSFPGDGGNLEGLVVDRIWVGQFGMDYRFNQSVIGTAQLDMHSRTIENSNLTAFGNSLQIQLGLGFPTLFPDYRLDVFFSEDILVESAPDISFGLRLIRQY
ncbi:MAG: DUF3187 family protein [Gammaproteobacteria bacterium]|nr:DUF3187 family protein [Gammaproteobacteria bacterium]